MELSNHMTISRKDQSGTEFGLWLREQSPIDSQLGFVATNIDYIWRTTDSKNPQWMIIEEKRFMTRMKPFQLITYLYLDALARRNQDTTYRGFHFIQFEKTSPEDGAIYLDRKEISKEDLISFLRFEKPEIWYQSYHPNGGLNVKSPTPQQIPGRTETQTSTS